MAAVAACNQLEVTNPNNPDAERALATASDAENLMSSYYKRWHDGLYRTLGNFEGMANIMSFQNSRTWRTTARILGGALERPVEGVERRDEVGDIARAVQLLKETLIASDDLSRRTQSAAEQVAAATSQAAAAVEQVSGGSQRQMQSVEAITGSVSRTTAIIGTIASVSLSAKDRSRAAATQLASGMTQMTAMTAAVREIAVTSARINSITQSIGELATRSNILSLNAAIEAARAGEHGRGFSVVAEEVGNLAQQTANLAQEIALLAADSGERIQNGVSIATDVGGVMNSVASAINRDRQPVGRRIAQSMEEQGAVLQQIELSLQRLTEISNANATASEEIAATMVELTRLADSTRQQAGNRCGGPVPVPAPAPGAASVIDGKRWEAPSVLIVDNSSMMRSLLSRLVGGRPGRRWQGPLAAGRHGARRTRGDRAGTRVAGSPTSACSTWRCRCSADWTRCRRSAPSATPPSSSRSRQISASRFAGGESASRTGWSATCRIQADRRSGF